MGLTSTILEDLGIVDHTIPEPLGGAHRDMDQVAENIKDHLISELQRLSAVPTDELLETRYQRLMSYGND
jgi:acetyl-CoA carboxylase carboxyl transferase subunit alpha